jgi:predicted aspartyl protease
MMEGVVNANFEATITVVAGKGKNLKSTKAVIDTGFSGFLSLPIAIITELDLQWKYSDWATLGDGNKAFFDIYQKAAVKSYAFRPGISGDGISDSSRAT